MADDLEKKKKLIQEINALYAKLGQTNPFGALEPAAEDMRFLLDLLRDVKEEVYSMDGGVNEMVGSWKAILDEAKAYSSSIGASKKALASLSSIASNVSDHHKEINILTGKQLESLKTKFNVEKESLMQLERSLSDQLSNGDLTNKQREESETLLRTINGLLYEQDSILQLTEDRLNTELNLRKEIEKKLGVTGGILRGISKIPILGDLVDTKEALQEAEDTIKRTGSGIRGLGAALGNLSKQTISGLLNPANMVLGVFTLMGKILKDVDSSAGDFAKSMNITYSQALGVRDEMVGIASASNDVAVNSSRLQESLLAINQSLGTNGKIAEQDLIIFTKLREQSGLTNEQLVSMQRYSMATGTSLKGNVEKFQATAKILSYQNKVALNTKQLMVDMGSVSNRTKLSIEGGAAGLAKAAFNAKLMGGDLEKVAAISEQLLNFESSIEAELSAELLTGKNLTLEKARQAALNNDMATVASEITKQMGSAKDFANSNRIQQEAMAKAVGMTAEQLGDMLFEQEALRKVGGLLNDEEKRAFETAKAKYGVEEASRRLREGQIDQLVDQQSIQDKFNQSVEKLKEIFVSMAEPVLAIVSPFIEMIGWLAKSKELLAGMAGLLIGIKTTNIVNSILVQRQIAAETQLLALKTGQAVAQSIISPWALAAGAVAALATSALIYNSMSKKVGDFRYSNKTGETTISTKEGGLYSISPNDEIAVAPKINTSLSNKTAPSTSSDLSALVNKIEQMFAKQQDRPVVVHSVVKTENNDVLARGVDSSNRRGFNIQ